MPRTARQCRQHAGKGDPVIIQYIPDMFASFLGQTGGIGMRTTRSYFDPFVSNFGDSLDRLFEGVGRNPDRETSIRPGVK